MPLDPLLGCEGEVGRPNAGEFWRDDLEAHVDEGGRGLEALTQLGRKTRKVETTAITGRGRSHKADDSEQPHQYAGR